MKTAIPRAASRRFSGSPLIVTQVALSMVVLVSAVLLVRTLQVLLATDLGYQPKGLLMAQAAWEGPREAPQRESFVADEMLSRFRSVPGVLSASRYATIPGGQNQVIFVPVPGQTDRRYPSFSVFVSPGHFGTVRTLLAAGRDFGPDDTETSPRVAILSETAARSFFAGVNPLGQTYREIDTQGGEPKEPVEVVGIVKDAQFRRPNEPPLPIVYLPISQCPTSCNLPGVYELRFSGPLPELKERMKDAVRRTDSHVAVDFLLATDDANETIQRERVSTMIATGFGLLTLALAMIGIYGVTSYATSQRVYEIGVRMALGAQPGNVFRMVVGEAVGVVAAAIVPGGVAGFATAKAIQRTLYGVAPLDPVTFGVAAAMMLFAAAIAALVPALRAANADPVIALRAG